MVTSPDGHDHLVDERVFAASWDGHYLARCGSFVISTALTAGPEPLCPLCFPGPGAAREDRHHERLGTWTQLGGAITCLPGLRWLNAWPAQVAEASHRPR
ncbi:hypothetical protein [Pseudonocardia aurantiaca]|uniref:Uncharacterized protein n=1 Tax=Pseudonocardia aurantiaca TaxID=75290 RepID=A0ABW4FGH8_9PSEU